MRARLIDLLRRFGPTMFTTLLSQGISAIALLSIVLLGPRVSDAYALAIQVGTSAFSGVILQVLYFVAVGRPWLRSWTMWTWLAAGFSVVFSAGVVAVTAATAGITPLTATSVLVFGAGGAFLAAAGVIGVRFAMIGRPVLMSGITIVPNVGLAVAAAAAWLAGARDTWGVYVPAIVWAVASLGVWIWCLRLRVPPFEGDADPLDGPRARFAHAATLSAGLVGGTIYPSLFIGALHALPAGTTTVLFLVSRIGTSIVGLLVNSVLAVRFNWNSDVRSTAPLATWIGAAALVASGASLAAEAGGFTAAGYVLAGAGWAASLVAAPLVIREMHARRMVLAASVKTGADLVLVLTAGTWFLHSPSVSGFFGIYVAQQAVSLLFGGFALRRVPLALVSAALLVVGVLQVVFPW